MNNNNISPRGTTWDEYEKNLDIAMNWTEKEKAQMKRWEDKIDRQVARREKRKNFLSKWNNVMILIILIHALATILCVVSAIILKNRTMFVISSSSFMAVSLLSSGMLFKASIYKLLDLSKLKSLKNEDIKYLEYENYREVNLNGLENITDFSPIEKNPRIKRYITPDGTLHIK